MNILFFGINFCFHSVGAISCLVFDCLRIRFFLFHGAIRTILLVQIIISRRSRAPSATTKTEHKNPVGCFYFLLPSSSTFAVSPFAFGIVRADKRTSTPCFFRVCGPKKRRKYGIVSLHSYSRTNHANLFAPTNSPLSSSSSSVSIKCPAVSSPRLALLSHFITPSVLYSVLILISTLSKYGQKREHFIQYMRIHLVT